MNALSLFQNRFLDFDLEFVQRNCGIHYRTEFLYAQFDLCVDVLLLDPWHAPDRRDHGSEQHQPKVLEDNASAR